MSEVKSVRKSIANAIVIVLLILVNLTALITISVGVGDMGSNPIMPDEPAAAEQTITAGDAPVGGSRGLNNDGDDYVDLYRFVNGDPQIQIDGAAYGVETILIGEPNVQLDIPVESLKPENASDRWGDDILYNVTVSIDESATTYYNTQSHTWVDASSYITWDASSVSPNFKENNANYGNALLIDGTGTKNIPWFYDDYGDPGFLDADNNQRASNDEFYQIDDDYKKFEGFIFDVDGNAPAGTYNISVEVSYIYQTFQNVSEKRLSSGGNAWFDPDTAGPSGTGDLGIFEYYFWEPYERNGGTVDFTVPGNIKFRKRFDYFENNVAPAGANWEAIPDLGYDNDNPNDYTTQAGGWDYHSNYDFATEGAPVTSWNDGGSGNLGAVVTNWNNWNFNDYATWGAGNSYQQRTVDQYPYNVYDGNGTWQYSGYEAETVWTTVKTEVEFVEIRVEHATRLTQAADNCHLIPEDNYYLKAGDEFKKMYLTLNNQDGANHMTDVFVNITLDQPEYFTLKHDWAWKDIITAGNNENFYYRIDANNDTPVGRYTGNATMTYTREHVRVTEVLPLELILYFTPNLRNHGGLPMTSLDVSKIIHTGDADTTVDFSISNTGNTLLENGLLTMDFSNFKHKGDEYTDPEGGEGTYSQSMKVPYMEYGPGSETYDIQMDVEIPNHWSLIPGNYKLFMNYDGYYFNDGVLGEPTSYVKVWMNWVDDDFDPDTDMNAYCVIDTDGDENMDIFAVDETRAIDGIYMYVEVEEFIPNKPDLQITDISINGGTDTFEQGSITNGQFDLIIANNGESNLTNLVVELDLYGYFKGSPYYEGYSHSIENPTDTIASLDMNDNDQVSLNIEGIDLLLPPGTHRLRLICTYDYDNGSTPSELSTDTEYVYFNVTVTDSYPDIIPTVGTNTGILRMGDKVVDINLYVNLANREQYAISHITGYLTVGDDTPFIPGEDTTTTGAVVVTNKWMNPANDHITANGQNMNNMYFNLNLHPNAEEGTYYLNLTLDAYNELTLNTQTMYTTLEVKVYPKIAKLRITDVSVSTGKIAPGKQFTLELTIQNDGGEAAREIYMEFKEAYVNGEAIIESHEDINPTGAKYPFSSEVMKSYIEEILPHSTGTATFTVRGDLNIYPGVTYFQNIEFYFKDSTGTDHTTTDIAPIKTSSSVKASLGGENYVWDTDREAWISESELASESIVDWVPWMITAAIIVWLVTLLIIFMFIIRPRYKKEKLKTKAEDADDSESELPHEKEGTIEGAVEEVQSRGPKESDDEFGETIDYRTGPEDSSLDSSTFDQPTDQQIPPPSVITAPAALPPAPKAATAKKAEESKSETPVATSVKDKDNEVNENQDDSDLDLDEDSSKAEPEPTETDKKEPLPKRGPKK